MSSEFLSETAVPEKLQNKPKPTQKSIDDPTHHDISESLEFLNECAQLQNCKTDSGIPDFPSETPQSENCKTNTDSTENPAQEFPTLKSEMPLAESNPEAKELQNNSDSEAFAICHLPSAIEASAPQNATKNPPPEKLQNKPEPAPKFPYTKLPDPPRHVPSEAILILKEFAEQMNCKTDSKPFENSAPDLPLVKSEIPKSEMPSCAEDVTTEILQNKLAPATQTNPAPQNPVSLSSSSLPSCSSRTSVEETPSPEILQNKSSIGQLNAEQPNPVHLSSL